MMQRIAVIDSHTGGEPTRVVIAGAPDLGNGSLVERRDRFRLHHDAFRRAVICEPRGSDVLVGAVLCQPSDPACVTGVIFFNNVGYLNMCGHGAIGLAVTLAHLGRAQPGPLRIETVCGVVEARLGAGNRVSLRNVASYRSAAGVALQAPGIGVVRGDIAWGGNWFFLVRNHGERLDSAQVARLTDVTLRIRAALRANNITGANGAEIDHVELFGPPVDDRNQSRNFVLCPGGAYDRSPCGTGTCAKVACLAADGLLEPGEIWRQESILGSVFAASYRTQGKQIIPKISGQAFVTAEATLLMDDADPLAWGCGS